MQPLDPAVGTVLKAAVIVFVFAFVSAATLYTSTQPFEFQYSDTDSNYRISVVNRWLRTNFGKLWPYTLVFFAFHLVLTFYFAHFAFSKTVGAINIDDQTASRIMYVMVPFTIIVALASVFAAAWLFAAQPNPFVASDSGRKYYDSEVKKKRNQRLVIVFGVGFAIVAVLGLAYYYLIPQW